MSIVLSFTLGPRKFNRQYNPIVEAKETKIIAIVSILFSFQKSVSILVRIRIVISVGYFAIFFSVSMHCSVSCYSEIVKRLITSMTITSFQACYLHLVSKVRRAGVKPAQVTA
jgi:hypothetical protein